MVEPRRLITPEIATRYDRSLHTVTKTWARHPDWPAPVGKRGRYKEYDADAVDAFVRQHVTRQTPDLQPGRLYTVQELAAAAGITEAAIRADLSRGRWPAPDDSAAGVHRWRGRTVTSALAERPSYTAPDDAQEKSSTMTTKSHDEATARKQRRQFADWVKGAANSAGYHILDSRSSGVTRLATATGMDRTTCSRMISGHTMPAPRYHQPLAEALHVTIHAVRAAAGLDTPPDPDTTGGALPGQHQDAPHATDSTAARRLLLADLLDRLESGRLLDSERVLLRPLVNAEIAEADRAAENDQ